MKTFICEIVNVGECEYELRFIENNKILESKIENCLDDCLLDIYEFQRNCYDKYCEVFDRVIVRVRDVEFGL